MNIPSDRYARKLQQHFSPHGRFVHMEPDTNKKKAAILVKNTHGDASLVKDIQAEPKILDRFKYHQDATYQTIRAFTRLTQGNCRVSLERLHQKPNEYSPVEIEWFRTATVIDNQNGDDQEQALKTIRRVIADNHKSAYMHLQLLIAGQRFTGQCLGRHEEILLPGSSPDRKSGLVDEITNEIMQMAVEVVNKGELVLENAPAKVGEWKQAFIDDHTARHQYCVDQMQATPKGIRDFMIVYGGDHTAYGYHSRPVAISKVPLENYLGDYRLFVFEPSGYREALRAAPSRIEFFPQDMTVEQLGQVILTQYKALLKLVDDLKSGRNRHPDLG